MLYIPCHRKRIRGWLDNSIIMQKMLDSNYTLPRVKLSFNLRPFKIEVINMDSFLALPSSGGMSGFNSVFN